MRGKGVELLVVEPANRLLGASEPERRVVFRHPREPDPTVSIEGAVLGEVGLIPDLSRIDVRVQHHSLHPRGEERGEHLAQICAIRIAVVADLVGAQRDADLIHVTR